MTLTRNSTIRLCSVLVAGALVAGTPLAAQAAAPFPSDSQAPDLVPLLSGYSSIWKADTGNTLHGTVVDATTLERDDALTVWINQHATASERLLALQDAQYDNTGKQFDQSVTVSTGLGSKLGPLYVRGRTTGALPLTTALINSQTGTAGAYVSTSTAKATFSHPRPYLPTDPASAPKAGDDPVACAPSTVNASSQAAIRVGKPWADAKGNLLITRVAPVDDTGHRFSPNDVLLDPGYGTAGLCTGGSFPSGHTTTAYEAGITLATLLPELAPELLTRASEAGNSRIVLGVHYPLDIMGGRIDGEAAIAKRWSDAEYRTEVLLPARAELVHYLEKTSGHPLAYDVRHQSAYSSNPYAGKRLPGGTAQVVVDRRTAVKVYTERLTYGFARTGTRHLAPSVPAGAQNLLRTTFPTLTAAQRRSVLAQTEISSGSPLDGSRTAGGSWERLDLAAATSATVRIGKHGSVRVLSTGGAAKVIERHHHR